MPAEQFDAIILGAGIAGLSLADALQNCGWKVCIIEKHSVASGASGTPGAMINPATGRRATKVWRAEECYDAIVKNLDKLVGYSAQPFWHNNGVLRPAITPKMAKKMREQYEKTSWREGWCQWLSEKEIKKRHPGITCVEGGLWLPVGITLDSAGYLKAYARYLKEQPVQILEHRDCEISSGTDCWTAAVSDQDLTARHLIYATGYGTLSAKFWDDLPFEPIKGQLAIFRLPEGELNFNHSISSMGYMAKIPQFNDRFVQGSTYEHDFKEVKTSNEGEKYLRNRLARTLPELAEKIVTEELWTGVRVSTPDKKPVIGTHRRYYNLHLFSGLGSKGLMYGKFLAEHFAGYLTGGQPLLKEVDITRFYSEEEQPAD